MLTFLNPWNRVYKNTAEARQEVTGKLGLLCRLNKAASRSTCPRINMHGILA